MVPFESRPEDRPWFLLFAAVAAGWAVAFFASAWAHAGGRFMLPLDDAYIHLQYARRLAALSPLQYAAGAPASSGATSPLWVALLAPAQAIGLGGTKGALVAFVLGGGLFALACCWAYDLARRLSGHCLPGAIAGGLLASNGHVAWCFFSGMETGLFAVLLLGAAGGLAAWWGEERRWGLRLGLACLALLPLARPEGAGIVVVAAVVAALRGRRARPGLSPWLVLPCLLPFVAWLGTLHVMTGSWKPAGLALKGLFADPEATWLDAAARAARTLSETLFLFHANQIPDEAYAAFKGRVATPYVPVGLLPLALWGGAMLALAEWKSRRTGAGTLLGAAWAAGLLSVAASGLPFVHEQRYLAPWTALALVLATVGLHRLALLFQDRWEVAMKAGALALLLAGAASVPFWTIEYGRDARDLWDIHRRMTFAVNELPAGSVLAISDAGILAYHTSVPTVDLIGLTSSELTAASRAGEGAIWEALEALPAARRPTHVATFRGWWSEGFALGELLAVTRTPRPSISSGDAMGLWKLPPWPDDEPAPFELDIQDPASERAAAYAFTRLDTERRPGEWPRPNALAHSGPDAGGRWLAEGTRWVTGESFELDVPAGERWELEWRVAPGTEWRPSARALEVEVVSSTAARRVVWLRRAAGSAWLEGELALDGVAGAGRARISVRSADPASAGWQSAHVRLVQLAPAEPPPPPPAPGPVPDQSDQSDQSDLTDQPDSGEAPAGAPPPAEDTPAPPAP